MTKSTKPRRPDAIVFDELKWTSADGTTVEILLGPVKAFTLRVTRPDGLIELNKITERKSVLRRWFAEEKAKAGRG